MSGAGHYSLEARDLIATMISHNVLKKLETRLGYQFENSDLAVLALTHRSYSGRSGHNNERLEFLGDSALNFLVAEALYRRVPKATEGQLSLMRSRLVRGRTLAELARELQLGDFLLLGPGELKTGGFHRESILADVLEALLGAIYLDAGLEACRQRVEVWFAERLEKVSVTNQCNKDAKTRLQEYLQARRQQPPVYQLLDTMKHAGEPLFRVCCQVADRAGVEAEGGSRRIAEQRSAWKMLISLGVEVEQCD